LSDRPVLRPARLTTTPPLMCQLACAAEAPTITSPYPSPVVSPIASVPPRYQTTASFFSAAAPVELP
jgi:hypothetical protein